MSKFIVFEGIDGSGSSTQADIIVRKLKEAGIPVLHTYEPSSGEIGRFIRNLFTRKEEMPNWKAMSLLFSADRMQHVQNVVEPSIENGDVVICERYYYSTIGYQVYTATNDFIQSEDFFMDYSTFLPAIEVITRKWIIELNKYAKKPDLTIVLSISPENALKRMSGRQLDQFEQKSDLQHYLAEYYDNLQKIFLHDNIYVVNSNRVLEIVTQDVWSILQDEGVL